MCVESVEIVRLRERERERERECVCDKEKGCCRVQAPHRVRLKQVRLMRKAISKEQVGHYGK